MFKIGSAQQYPTPRICSVAVNSVGFLWLLMVCTGILFFGGCKQPNDPVTPDTPAQTEDPPKTDNPTQTEDTVQPDMPTQPDTLDQIDTAVPSEQPAMIELTGVSALHDYLDTLPGNTEDTPYRIKVNGIDLEKTTTSGDTLRALYDALSRYVALDLSGCTGDKLPNVTTDTAPAKAYLVSLILPATVSTIAVNAFSGCTPLTSVNMPQVTTIIHGAFSNLPKLRSVYMPEVQIIETGKDPSKGVFYKCTALTSVSMPKLTSLGDYAFYGCTDLRSITLGPVPPVLEGANVFKNAKPLSAIYVPAAAVTGYATTDKANWTSDLKEKVQALP